MYATTWGASRTVSRVRWREHGSAGLAERYTTRHAGSSVHSVASELLPTHTSQPPSETDRRINDLRVDGVFATHRLLRVSAPQSSASQRCTYLYIVSIRTGPNTIVATAMASSLRPTLSRGYPGSGAVASRVPVR